MGAVYGPVSDRVKAPPVVKGMGFGLLVWAASYLGIVPALGLIAPATRHRAQRNALMIVAHLVWGATLGLLTAWWSPRKQEPQSPGTPPRQRDARGRFLPVAQA
jgi:putative membrane protein